MAELPSHLPILDARPRRAGPPRLPSERELTRPTRLCDARGRLDPGALGWSRFPLVTANLRGHWPRKKRWNFWNWLSPRFSFSVTVADIDYAAFCAFFLVDFETGERVEAMDLRRGGFAPLPEEVERSIAWSSPRAELAIENEGGDLAVRFRGRARGGQPVAADFTVHKPRDHESLNVVVPWTPTRFQLNSKHNTLRCQGFVDVDGRRYELRPDACHAVQDWGRGIWPYRSCWNWGVASGEVDGELLGVNMGDRWTTGTGANENGILHRGRLTKLMEDLEWRYDPREWRRPWRVRSRAGGHVDLVLEPFHVHTSRLDLGLVATGGTIAFGRWRGIVRTGDAELELPGLVGFAEEFAHRW
jgi:Domain of unknown function (DUF2804), N-terminal/Domain of unknown function (DUF2804), C-terminal